MKVIYHLLYSSEAAGFVAPKAVEEILKVSRQNNERSEVTGLLLYRLGRFIQMLEEEEKEVKAIYERVKQDNRHSHIKIMAEFQTKSRLFQKWNMGYIRDEKQVGEISQKLAALVAKPVLVAEDMKKQVIELFSRVNTSKLD